jgi:hypothetical protein
MSLLTGVADDCGTVEEEEPHAASAARLRAAVTPTPIRRGHRCSIPRAAVLVWCWRSDLFTEAPARHDDARVRRIGYRDSVTGPIRMSGRFVTVRTV